MTDNNETPLTPDSSDAAAQEGAQKPVADAAAQATPPPAADAAAAGLPAARAETAALPAQPVGPAAEAAAAPPAPAKPFWSRTGTRVVAGVAAGVVLLGVGFGGRWAAHGELRGFGHPEAQGDEWPQGHGDGYGAPGHGDRGGHGDSEFRGGDGFRGDDGRQNGGPNGGTGQNGGPNDGTGQNGTRPGSPSSPDQSPAPESTTPSD